MNDYKKYMDNILNYKQAYANAEKANDQTGMNTAAQKAAQYYEKLRSDSQGKTIADNLSNLDYEGAKGNALAASASTNGGNIDSNAAANAMRQQATLVQMGQSQVMDMYNNRISRMNDILSNLGVQIQAERNAENQNISNTIAAANNSFNNSETRKNNEYARQADIANITGETPDWMGNPYFNSDGTLKSGYDMQIFRVSKNILRQL